MLALTKKEDKDSFNVSIIGEHAAALTVNAEGKHPYTMADMSLGENIYSVSLSRKGTYLITSYYSTARACTAPCSPKRRAARNCAA